MKRGRGSISSEVVVLVPTFMIIVILFVYVGRLTQTESILQQVSDVAAREASMSHRDHVLRTAVSVTQRELSLRKVSCTHTGVSTRQVSHRGLTSIQVTVRCSLNMEGLIMLRLPARTMTATSSAVIDRYRS